MIANSLQPDFDSINPIELKAPHIVKTCTSVGKPQPLSRWLKPALMFVLIGCATQTIATVPNTPTCTIYFWGAPSATYTAAGTVSLGEQGSPAVVTLVRQQDIPNGNPARPVNLPSNFVMHAFDVTVSNGLSYVITVSDQATIVGEINWTQADQSAQIMVWGTIRFGT